MRCARHSDRKPPTVDTYGDLPQGSTIESWGSTTAVRNLLGPDSSTTREAFCNSRPWSMQAGPGPHGCQGAYVSASLLCLPRAGALFSVCPWHHLRTVPLSLQKTGRSPKAGLLLQLMPHNCPQGTRPAQHPFQQKLSCLQQGTGLKGRQHESWAAARDPAATPGRCTPCGISTGMCAAGG